MQRCAVLDDRPAQWERLQRSLYRPLWRALPPLSDEPAHPNFPRCNSSSCLMRFAPRCRSGTHRALRRLGPAGLALRALLVSLRLTRLSQIWLPPGARCAPRTPVAQSRSHYQPQEPLSLLSVGVRAALVSTNKTRPFVKRDWTCVCFQERALSIPPGHLLAT